MSGVYGMPDYYERPGTLTMRGNHMNYSRGVLTGNWHQARESEPKDYVISTDPVRNLKRATYNRLASITDDTLPVTTYQDLCGNSELKDAYKEREDRKCLVNAGNFFHVALDERNPGQSESSVLPHHHPDHDKFRGDTTYITDFQVPYPYTPAQPAESEDNTIAYKKCHSQFTDTADYRRPGRNTWQDESGVYANSMQKLAVVKSTKDLIPSWQH